MMAPQRVATFGGFLLATLACAVRHSSKRKLFVAGPRVRATFPRFWTKVWQYAVGFCHRIKLTSISEMSHQAADMLALNRKLREQGLVESNFAVLTMDFHRAAAINQLQFKDFY
jgi:hypothetical protein